MPQPEDLRKLMADHHLTISNIVAITGVNQSTVKAWVHDKGPKYKPIPDDLWALILKVVGE